MKKFFIILISTIVISCYSDNRYTKYPVLGISLILPDRHVQMNAEEIFFHFIKEDIDSTIVINQSNKINNIQHTAIYLQDTSDIYNSILMIKSPYFNLNQSSFKEIKAIAYEQLSEIYKNNGSIRRTSSKLSQGYYPYARLSFDIMREADTLHVTWYTINKQKTSINIFVNNNSGSEYEEMIKTLL